MSIANSEQQPAKHHRFAAVVPHIPISMILLAAAIAVALLIGSRNNRSPEQVAHLEGPHPFLTQVKASIDPLTHWQPRSGQIRITLESTGNANLADTNISVYFRWRTKSNAAGGWVRTPNLHVVDLQNAQKLTVAAQVPELPDAPSNGLRSWIAGGGNGVGEFLGLVPVADVWITAKPNGSTADAVLADVVESIGVTSVWMALGAALGAILLLAWFLRGVKPEGLAGSNLCLQIIETRGGRASLSQFQIVLWMFIGGVWRYLVQTAAPKRRSVLPTSGACHRVAPDGGRKSGSQQTPQWSKKDFEPSVPTPAFLPQERREFRHSDRVLPLDVRKTTSRVAGRSSRGRPVARARLCRRACHRANRRRCVVTAEALALDPPEHVGKIDIARTRL